MDTHLFFAQETYSQVLLQMGSHMSSLLKNFSFQVLYKLVPMFFFLKISVKLQV